MLIPTAEEKFMDEFWFDLTSLEVPNIAPIFKISTWGRVLNTITGNCLPKNIDYDKNHYITIRLSDIQGKPIFAQPHRLVMLSFFYIPNHYLFDVNHKDGIKYHNWIWNLEWTTHKENMEHAVNNELFRYGEDHSNHKLSNDQAEEICRLISEGKGPKEISDILNIPNCNIPKIVQNIKLGYSWKKVSRKYGIIE